MAATLIAGCEGLGASNRSQQDPEVTFDGLHRVRGALVDRLWVRPGASLDGKSKILPSFGGITYRDTRAGRAERSRLSETQLVRLESTLHEVFHEELTRDDGWQIAEAPGPDVVKIRAWLTDVVVQAPTEPRSGRESSWVASAGEATLVVEIFDSETRQILARAADRRRAERSGGGLMRATSVSQRAEVRRMFRYWARRLRSGLDEVRAMGTFEID